MRHDKIIGQVQARAQLASRGEAEAATRATLETLGERITPGAAENLAAQLRGDSWPVAPSRTMQRRSLGAQPAAVPRSVIVPNRSAA